LFLAAFLCLFGNRFRPLFGNSVLFLFPSDQEAASQLSLRVPLAVGWAEDDYN
jgi:hypothetical protein